MAPQRRGAVAAPARVPTRQTTLRELLRLVGAVRRLAFDRTLPPSEALGRIRDAYRDYDNRSQS
jgi:hypothetical protein